MYKHTIFFYIRRMNLSIHTVIACPRNSAGGITQGQTMEVRGNAVKNLKVGEHVAPVDEFT